MDRSRLRRPASKQARIQLRPWPSLGSLPFAPVPICSSGGSSLAGPLAPKLAPCLAAARSELNQVGPQSRLIKLYQSFGPSARPPVCLGGWGAFAYCLPPAPTPWAHSIARNSNGLNLGLGRLRDSGRRISLLGGRKFAFAALTWRPAFEFQGKRLTQTTWPPPPLACATFARRGWLRARVLRRFGCGGDHASAPGACAWLARRTTKRNSADPVWGPHACSNPPNVSGRQRRPLQGWPAHPNQRAGARLIRTTLGCSAGQSN